MGGVFPCYARITGAFVRRTLVERQKAGVLLVQPCGHIGFKFVQCKIHQRALVEREHQLVGTARGLKLIRALKASFFSGRLLLQLQHGNRNPVEEQRQVDAQAVRLVLVGKFASH